jgi:hypothetical protein
MNNKRKMKKKKELQKKKESKASHHVYRKHSVSAVVGKKTAFWL